jgi:hypothetical protein
MKRELFYVAKSRGRARLTVVTSDAEALRESVGRTSARQSASELARKAMVQMPRGVRRGVAAAIELVRLAQLAWLSPSSPEVVEQRIEGREKREHGIGR